MSPTPTKNMFLFLLTHLLLLKADSKCQQSYTCRNFSFQFPFTDINYPQCGLLSINCNVSEEEHPKVYLGAREYQYEILEKVSASKFLIHDSILANYFKAKSCFSFGNVSLLKSPSVSFTYSPTLTIFSCYNPSNETKHHFAQYKNRSCDILEVFYTTPATHVPDTDRVVPPGCVIYQPPIKPDQDYSGDLFNLLSPNFTLEWNVSKACSECYHQGGQCLTNTENEFYCKQDKQGSVIFQKLDILLASRLDELCLFLLGITKAGFFACVYLHVYTSALYIVLSCGSIFCINLSA